MATTITCPGCGTTTDSAAPYCQKCGRPLAAAQPGVVQPVAVPVRYAGFWIRFLAIIIDFVILGAVLFPFRLGMWFGPHVFGPGIFMFGFGLLGVRIVIWWLYFSLMESSAWQATLGKKVVGVKVVDYNGQRITWGRATGRYFSKYLSGLILFIGYIMAGFTARQQALHDMIAGTYVIYGR